MCKYCANTFENKPVNEECLLETKIIEQFHTWFGVSILTLLFAVLLFYCLEYFDCFHSRTNELVSLIVVDY